MKSAMITLPPETEELTRRIAAQRGKTPEEVVNDAIETQARLAGITLPELTRKAKPIDMDRVHQISQRIVSRPLIDRRSAKDILDEAWGVSG